jgi:hypothetical protein
MENFPDSKDRCIAYWMVRFEKINYSEISWFAKAGDISHTLTVGQHACIALECHKCHKRSKHIYDKGWTCLNHLCTQHFLFMVNIDDQVQWQLMKSEQVQYSFHFLSERSDGTNRIKHRHELVPQLPTINTDVSFGVEEEFKRGIVCPYCRCASRRVYWNNWRCENGDCNFAYQLETRIYPLSEVANETKKAKTKNKIKHDQELTSEWKTNIAGYKVQNFTLVGEDDRVCGVVTVFRATEEICAKPTGPDNLFLSLQDQNVDYKLKRNAARHRG